MTARESKVLCGGGRVWLGWGLTLMSECLKPDEIKASLEGSTVRERERTKTDDILSRWSCAVGLHHFSTQQLSQQSPHPTTHHHPHLPPGQTEPACYCYSMLLLKTIISRANTVSTTVHTH